MAGISKRVSGAWVSGDERVMKTATDIIVSPTTIYADGTNATVGLVGNMVQNGTPSPSSIIMPSECGDKTGNLFDVLSLVNDMHLNNVTGLPVSYSGRIASPNPVDVTQYTSVTISYTTAASIKAMYSIFSNDDLVGRFTAISSGTVIDVSNADKMYVCFYDIWGENINTSSVSNIMLNSGSTPLPYEPYGYKIPILSASTTTPVYLGEVETTRKIKKYEFTGSETWNVGSENFYCFVPETSGDGVPYSSVICSHCSGSTINNTGKVVFVKKSEFPNITTGAELKQYCLEQYANGTPVTIWYVLATPTTGIVNEPLRKIGDYADTVSGITIPTIAGANTLSVGTTLQPSEVSVTYKGWHPVPSVHERENGQWD